MSVATRCLSPSERRTNARILAEFGLYKPQVALIIFLGLVISAIQPLSVRLSARIIDELHAGMNPEFFRWFPIAIILIFLASGLAKYFYMTTRRYVGEKILTRLRVGLFKKYLVLPMSVIDQSRTGDMLSSIQNDLAQIASGLDTYCDLLKEPFTFLGLLGMAFYCDWRLALSTLIVAPLVAFLFSRSGAAVKRYSARNLALFSDLLSLSQESLVGARVVKVFRLEGPLFEKFQAVHDRYFKTMWKSIRVQELSTPVVEFIGALLMAGVMIYASYRISAGTLTKGQLVAFLLALGLAQMPLKQINNAYLKIKGAEAAADRVYALLDSPELVEKPSGARRVNDLKKGIVFDRVSLHYGEKEALRNVSFTVNKGECVAFVGHSGSGKSSIANLLPRLYEPSGGSILLDGTDIRELFVDDLRNLFSFVTQEVFLFNDTLYENIRYGKPEASEAEITDAAELAHCMDFIRNRPLGFQTRIGDRGACLSGGERQRVAIARAFLKGAPILVLDEATSSLDSQSERVVQEALERLMAGKTTFLITHRFSTILRAGKIFVLDRGQIRQSGTHEQLLTEDGIYHGLYEKQVIPHRSLPC